MISLNHNQSFDDLQFENNVHYMTIDKDILTESLLYLKEHWMLDSLVDVFVIDYENNNAAQRYCINYLLKSMQTFKYVCIQVYLNDFDKLDSYSNIYPNAFISETEVKDLFGINYNFIKDPNFSLINSSHFPMRKDFSGRCEKKLQEIEVSKKLTLSPSHFLIRNDLELNLELDDDIVKTCNLNRGFHHCGIEKSFESLEIEKILGLTNKISIEKTLFYSVLFADTFEKILNFQASERAMAIRMVMLELERIKNNFFVIAMISYELGVSKYYQDMMFYIDRIKEVISFYCKSIVSAPFSCVGGVRFDIPHGWIATCINVLDKIENNLNDFNQIAVQSSFWIDSLKTGKITSKQAIEWGLTGPNLRASGVNSDMRKKSPYYFYSDVEFEIPIGQSGLVLDRYLVRVEEIFQSIKIINQILDNLPTGEIISKDAINFRNYKYKGGLINEMAMEDYLSKSQKIPEIKIYNAMESSNGETGLYLEGNNTNFLNRVKIVSSSNNTVGCLENIMTGLNYQDVLLTYCSLDINVKEAER